MPRLSYNVKWILISFVIILLSWWITFLFAQPELKNVSILIKLPIAIFLVVFVYWIVKIFSPSWIKGSAGEYSVGKELNKLPKEYLHVSDFHKGKTTNVDSVVIGPTGIFAIEVKNTNNGIINFENDYLTINGSKFEGRDCLSQAFHESRIIQEHISKELNESLPVTPVLVFANPRVKLKFGMQPQKGVYIVGIKWLTKLIQHGLIDNRFTPGLCSKIKENLNKYSSDIV